MTTNGDHGIEERLRQALGAEPAPVAGDAWERIERRVRREPLRRAGVAGMTLAVVAAVGLGVVPGMLPDRTVTTPPAGPPPSDAPVPAPAVETFVGFYPVTTLDDARRLQDSVDNGHQPLTLLPEEVARQFARDYIGWEAVEVGEVRREGSADAGWRAHVELRPYIGEGDPPTHLGARHQVDLVGLRGAEEPTWFVAGIHSENIVIDGLRVEAGRVMVNGRAVAYEATILVELRDLAGTVLYPRRGTDEGYTMGGATEPAPFVATVPVREPPSPEGVLILRSSSGIEGPAPDWTAVRVPLHPTPAPR